MAPLSPLEAYDEVMAFAAARGEDALRLAMHAAVPQVLRPELVHLLRLNFVPEAGDDPAVEADVLFAPFCAHLGGGYYRFDEYARRHLLKQLDPAYRGELVMRSRRVGSFLMSYFGEQCRLISGSNDAVHAAYVEVERWVALAFFDPASAAQQLAAAVRDASDPADVAARLRLGGLSGALSTPLAQHPSLLAYAAGVEAIERGDLARAQDLFEPLGDREISVGSVALRSPQSVLDEQVRPAAQAASNVDVIEEPLLESVGEHVVEPDQSPDTSKQAAPTVFISYAHRDERWRVELEKFLQPLKSKRNIEMWNDRSIHVGEDWQREFHDAIQRARVAVLLVSANYLTSEFIVGNELVELESRMLQGDLRLIWVPVSACPWQQTQIAKYQSAINPDKPLDQMRTPQRNKALSSIVRAIELALEDQAAAAPSREGPDIFICYRRETDRGRVGRLMDRLSDYYGTERLFQDITSIPPGTDFLEMIQRRVDQSAIMLVLIDRDWLTVRDRDGRRRLDGEHDILRLELAAALRRQTRVLPILLGGAWMPSEDELPPDIASLARWNAIQLSDDYWNEGIEKVKRAIDQSLGGDEPQSRSAPLLQCVPKQLFLVIQRELTSPGRMERVFNLDSELSTTGRSMTIHRMELELLDPRGSTMRMQWALFYEYADAGVMQRSSNAHAFELSPSSQRSLGIQFRAETGSSAGNWPVGDYQLHWHVWLTAARPDTPPDRTQSFAFAIDRQVEAQIRPWINASDDMWRRLTDNAIGIPLTLKREEDVTPPEELA